MGWKRGILDSEAGAKRYVALVAFLSVGTALATVGLLPDEWWTVAERPLVALATASSLAAVAGYRRHGLLVGVGGAVTYFLLLIPVTDFVGYVGGMTFFDWALLVVLWSAGLGVVTGIAGYSAGAFCRWVSSHPSPNEMLDG